MAKQTFQNQGGRVSITFSPGYGEDTGIEVEAGGTYATDNEEEKAALRKAGFKVKSGESKTSTVSSYPTQVKKEND